MLAGASSPTCLRVFRKPIIMLAIASCRKWFSGSLIVLTFISVSKFFFNVLCFELKTSPQDVPVLELITIAVAARSCRAFLAEPGNQRFNMVRTFYRNMHQFM